MATPAVIPRFLLPRLSFTPARAAAFWTSATTTVPFQRPPLCCNRQLADQQRGHHLASTFPGLRVPQCRQNLYRSNTASTRHTRPSQQALPLTLPTFHRTPPFALRLASCRTFSSATSRRKDHHFDTLKFVQRLQAEGFTEAQSQAALRVLSDAISESIQNLTRTMVLREDALKTSYTQKVDFSALRTELLSLDSSESALTRTSHERLTNELQKLNNRLRDEVQRTQASVRLDLNLEKGRVREEANVQELKIKETETRIEQEVAGLRERVEGVKFSTLQWLMGVCTGTAALILGAWRLLM